MNILAMDLGKSKTVFCEYDSQTGEHSFGKVTTSPQAIHDLLVDKSPERVVFEVGPSSGWVHDICCALKLDTEVANPNTEGWRWKNVKSKTDRKDALKLAQLSSLGQIPVVHVPGREVRQRRMLINYRQGLVERVVGIKNSIRSILDREGLTMASGRSGWTLKSVERLKGMSRALSECGVEELWRGELSVELEQLDSANKALGEVTSKLDTLGAEDERVQLLETIPGVGGRLAEAVVAFIDDPHRFACGKQVGNYVGLTPKRWQSGSMDRQGKISGAGNGLLRKLLVEVSWIGLRHNSWMRETYERLLRGSPSRKKIAIVGVARRLLIRCWAMLRDNEPWRYSEKDDVCEAA